MASASGPSVEDGDASTSEEAGSEEDKVCTGMREKSQKLRMQTSKCVSLSKIRCVHHRATP